MKRRRLVILAQQARRGIVFGGASIQLSGTHAIAEDAAVGADIGILSVSPDLFGTYTFTIAADPDSKFQLNVDGVTLEVGAALDYETATSHSVTIQADPGSGNPVLTHIFTITVTDVLETGLRFNVAANSQYLPFV